MYKDIRYKDIQLNPTLWNVCKLDATKYCHLVSKKAPIVQDCLRLQFQRREINTNSKCYGEVRRIYLKVLLIYLQMLIYTKLARQRNTEFFYDIPIGAAQMSS